MPTVASIDGVKIQFYNDEHEAAHFHAVYAEHIAMIDIETLRIRKGDFPLPQYRKVRDWAKSRQNGVTECLVALSLGRRSRKDQMKKIPRIKSTEPVIHGVLKIVWVDGYEGIVDIRPVIARGKIFTYLQKPQNFAALRIEEFGHSIGWINEKGQEIEFGSDSLREKAENQEKLQKLVSNMHF